MFGFFMTTVRLHDECKGMTSARLHDDHPLHDDRKGRHYYIRIGLRFARLDKRRICERSEQNRSIVVTTLAVVMPGCDLRLNCL